MAENLFEDLIPQENSSAPASFGGLFDDLIPQQPSGPAGRNAGWLGLGTESMAGIAGGATSMTGSALKGLASDQARDPAEQEAYAGFIGELSSIRDMDQKEYVDFVRRVREGTRGGNDMNLLAVASQIRNGSREPDDIPQELLDVLPKQKLEETPLYRAGEATQKFGERVFAPADDYKDSWTRAITEGVGSTIPFLVTGAVPGLGAGLSAGLGMAAGQGEAIDRAQKAGADEAQIQEAARLGRYPGLTDMVPIEILFERFGGAIPIPAAGTFGRIVGKVLTQAAAEGGQEGVQQAMQNIIANYVYDPEQDISEGVLEAAGMGAIVGGMFGGAGGIAGEKARRARGQSGQQSAATQPEGLPPGAAPAESVIGEDPFADLVPSEPAQTVEPVAEADPERLSSPRLTESDRASPLPNAAIDDGKRIMEDALAGRPVAAPDRGPQEFRPQEARRDAEAQDSEPPAAAGRLGGDPGTGLRAGQLPGEPATGVSAPRLTLEPVEGIPLPPAIPGKIGTKVRSPEAEEQSPGESWVIRERATGDTVMETFDRRAVEALNTEKYEAVPARQYLEGFNRATREAGGVQPTNEAVSAAIRPEPQEQPALPPVTKERKKADARAIVSGKAQIERVDPSDLAVDAKTFQFKEGGDTEGVTERLRGVTKWRPEFAGTVIVWEANDGKRYVADGHQRTGLARRIMDKTGEKIEMPAVVFKERDGYAAADVRQIAALKNIAEGSGSSLDAAKVMRSGNISEEDRQSLPKTGALARDATGLAALSDDAFGMVVNEIVRPEIASAVGRLAPDRKVHAQMLQALKREGAQTIIEAESMVRDMLSVATTDEQQDNLFGAEETRRMLLKERAQVRAAAMRKLRKDKSVFTMLSKDEQIVTEEGNVLQSDANQKRAQTDARLIEIIDRLSNRAGPVSDAFNAAARNVGGGQSPAGAAEGFVRAVRGTIERDGGIGDGAGAPGPVDAPPRQPAPQVERGAEGRDQFTLGAEFGQRPAEAAQIAADKPLRPNAEQRPMDDGLFGDSAGQTDLLDMARRPPPAAAPVLPEMADGADANSPAQTGQELEAVAASQAEPDPPAATDLLGEPSRSNEPIEDFGEVLEGARKMTVAQYAAQLDENVDVAREPLSKSFPAPNYEKLAEQAVPTKALAATAVFRAHIPPKPRQPYKVKRWAEQVATLRDSSRKLLSGEVPLETVMENARNSPGLRNVALTVEAISELPAADLPRAAKYRIESGSYSMFAGQRFSPAKTLYTIVGPNGRMMGARSGQDATAFYDEDKDRIVEKARAAIMADIAAQTPADKTRSKYTDVGVYRDRKGDGGLFLGFKVGREVIRVREGFDTVGEARTYLAENRDAVQSMVDEIRSGPNERKAENLDRVGKDYREGDVTPDRFAQEFGFRGVQFGNYVEGPRRQSDLNQAYDALKDLADTLAIPPRALALNGSLGLAFGARGRGGKRAFAAHYEPTNIVINLTKGSGPGSLAHEWVHAVDNYFGAPGKPDSYISEGTKSDVRPEVREAWKGISDALDASKFKERSFEYDKARSKPYWSTKRELVARSFERYIIDRLAKQDFSNDYLANIDMIGGAYPSKKEMADGITAAWDKLFDTLETRETDKGVELFDVRRMPDVERYSLPDGSELRVELERSFGDKAEAIRSQMRAELDRLGLGEIGINVVDTIRLIHNGEVGHANGRYFRGLIDVALDSADPHAAMQHEAIHALRHTGAFDKKEWAALERRSKAVWMKKYGIPEAYGFAPEMTQIEEGIAHAYAAWHSGRQKEAGVFRTAFEKIRNLIEAIRNSLQGNGFRSSEDIFGDIFSGKIGARRSQEQAQAQDSPAFNVAPSTDSAAFKRWFGDSKVVDADGKPLVVYHGTGSDFDAFSSDAEPTNYETDRGTFHFTDNLGTAEAYSQFSGPFGEIENESPRVIKAYLSLQSPMEHNARIGSTAIEEWDSDGDTIKKFAQRGRHDGVIIRPGDGSSESLYIAFSPSQIKSVNNRGTFDPNDDRIMFSLGEEPRTAQEHQDRLLGFINAKQPIDSAFRAVFAPFGGYDSDGRWNPGKKITAATRKTIVEAKFSDESPVSFINPMLEKVRAGVIDRYGLDADYLRADRERALDQRSIVAEGEEFLKLIQNASVGRQEAKVLQAMLTGEDIGTAEMEKLAEPIRKAIDDLGQQAVELGLISNESYERNRGAYLHRVYQKHETQKDRLVRWAEALGGSARKRIIGNELKGRGIFLDVAKARLVRDSREWAQGYRGDPQVGDKLRVLDEFSPQTEALDSGKKEKAIRRVYLPADMPVPERYTGPAWKDQGVWEIRGKKGDKFTVWRDYTKPEREAMGEILDARYTVAKTYLLMANDLANGRFFQKVAANEQWSQTNVSEGEWRNSSDKDNGEAWVKVPDTTIPGTGGKKRYAGLAGRFVRSEIWRDINELERMQNPGWWRKILTQWKLNKTARNPVVHMNNIMSNIVLADMVDVAASDIVRGVQAYASGDEMFQDALKHGAFGADMISQEIRENHLKPVLDEIVADGQGENSWVDRASIIGKLATIWDKVAWADQKMRDAYQAEDEIFRMALFIKRRRMGDDAFTAAQMAREQFLDYDIRAPWINLARNTALPFISYTYRAVPLIATAMAERPHKLAKYATLAFIANALAYALDDEGDEEKERAAMRPEEQGYTWLGTPRMIRLPYRDANGMPVFIDIRRWIPAGDIFDTNQGSSAVPIPAWLQFGGPMMLAGEFLLNKQGFTGEPITNELTDTTAEKLWKVADWGFKSWMPSAPWIPGSWYWQKIADAAAGATDYSGNPYSLPQAILSSTGIKVKPLDVESGLAFRAFEGRQEVRDLRAQARRLGRQKERGLISESAYERDLSIIVLKLERIAERMNLLGEVANR